MSITNNEITQNSKSEPKKFSILCTFKVVYKTIPETAQLPFAGSAECHKIFRKEKTTLGIVFVIFSLKKVVFVTDSLPYEIDANKIARFRPCCEMSDFKSVDNTKEQI